MLDFDHVKGKKSFEEIKVELQCHCKGKVVFSTVGTCWGLSKYELVGKCVKCGRIWKVCDITTKAENAIKATLRRITMEEEQVNLLTLTDKNFEEEVLKSDIPVLIDFWAEWCTPCHMVSPIVEELAKEYNGKLKVGKLDVASNGSIAQQYKIMAIPNLLIFKEGKVVSQIIGAVPKKDITSEIDKVLA